MTARSALKNVRRLVVKVGTGLLTGKNNRVSPAKVRQIASQVAALKKEGREVILVSSGAVGIGLGILRRTEYPRVLSERQALAALGQSRLMHMYETFFRPHRIHIGQVLLTGDDLHVRARFLNAKNTFLKLLQLNAVPVVNENDTVSVEEIKIGDNDTLSANVLLVAEAELLVILTDTDGLYDRNPKRFKSAQRLSEVRKIDGRVEALAKGTDSKTAIGGMTTKLKAARMAAAAGVPSVIASGLNPNVLQSILNGEDVGTFFPAGDRKLSHKEKWIAHSRAKRGSIVVDDGCRRAVLASGKSILPIGVREVRGNFRRGDAVSVVGLDGAEIGTGLVNYDAAECSLALGQKFREEVIHRDNFVRAD